VSIVRVGLAETKNFSEGYEAIFGKKQKTQQDTGQRAATNKKASPSRTRASASSQKGRNRKTSKKSSKK
jgi:hypothetical protein